MHSGLTAPRIVTERTIAQIERMLAVPIDEAIIPSMAKVASEADRERIREVVRDVVTPADTAFLDTLRGEYRHASREEPGIWSAPNGDQLYRTAIRSWTTLDLDPEEVHQTGLDEIEQIEAERREIARSGRLRRRHRRLPGGARRRPGQHPGTKAELVEPRRRGHRARDGRRAALLRRPAPRRLRGPRRSRSTRRRTRRSRTTTRPRRTARARASTTPTATTSRAASTRSSRRRPTTRPRPGHHFQITLEMENPHLNTFRRLGARMVGGAYVEGWGLYSERLADEMGLFRNEAERFGMLDAQAWRAARLVVDTGLHALRWERQRSIDFLQEAGLSETDAVIETDRYICWPGQALTYKIGQREIERLRAELSARDGSASTCGRSTTPSSATARCRWRRCRASSRTGWPRRPDGGPCDSGVEADAEGVEGPQDEAAPALVAVGAVELVADRLDGDRAERLGRERDRRARDDPEPKPVLVGSQDEVAHDAAGPAAGPDARGPV